MNKQRRAELMKAHDFLDQAHATIQCAAEEEQEYYDNMPEGIQNGEKGDRAQEVIDALETAADELDSMKDSIMDSAG